MGLLILPIVTCPGRKERRSNIGIVLGQGSNVLTGLKEIEVVGKDLNHGNIILGK